MNFFSRWMLAASALAICAGLSGCGSDKGKPLSDYRNPSTLDSMIYYYGQVQGYDYLKRAQNDTSMLTEEQRRLYLDGVRAGIEALREGAKNEIYNQGVRRGARIAMKVMKIEREYNVTFNDDFFMESLTYVLMNPEIHNNGIAAQKSFYNLYDGIRNKHRSDMRKEAMRNLTEEARDLKLSKIDSNLYYRIIHKGSGEYPHPGDALYVAVDFEKTDGTNLGMPATERVIVGAPGVMPIMNHIYTSLTKGSTGIFATTADAVFGPRAEISGLDSDEVLIITAKINDIIHRDEQSVEESETDTPSL